MEKLIACKSCGNQISKKAKMCPHCGRKYKKVLWGLIIPIPILIILGIILWPVITQIGNDLSEISKEDKDAFFNSIKPIKKVYVIGEKGPAGGLVFYDKGESSMGWRYLEAAPPETEFVNIPWGTYKWDIDGTSDTIGSGQRNTQIIVNALKDSRINETGKIAQLINQLNYNGYTDWFLPSKDELYWMYHNLAQRGLGGFVQARYWSSTQYNANSAWYIHFGDNGRDSHNYDKRRIGDLLGFSTGELRARAIRAFQ